MKKKVVLISCFDWYEDRLIHVEKYFENHGYEVVVFLSEFDHQEKKAQKKYKNSNNIKYITVPVYQKNISFKRIYSHFIFSKKIKKNLLEIHPNIIYGLVPPNSIVRTIVKLKNRINYKMVFDIIDMWPESFPKGNKKLLPFLIWKKMRDKYLDKADLIVVECSYYKDILSNIVKMEKIYIFRLVKKSLKIENISNPLIIKEKSLNLCYLGSINNLIDIERILDIVKKLKRNYYITFKIIGDGENRNNFINALNDLSVNVQYFGKIYEDKKKYEIFCDCHFGINIYKQSLNIGLTMKSVDYFQMGIPIINSIHGDTELLVSKYGVGINIEEISSKKIEDFLTNTADKRKKVLNIFNTFFSEENVNERLSFLDLVV